MTTNNNSSNKDQTTKKLEEKLRAASASARAEVKDMKKKAETFLKDTINPATKNI